MEVDELVKVEKIEGNKIRLVFDVRGDGLCIVTDNNEILGNGQADVYLGEEDAYFLWLKLSAILKEEQGGDNCGCCRKGKGNCNSKKAR
jgi:hypothetical protein